MSHQLTIDLGPDPEVGAEIEKMKGLVAEANESHVVRAAIRYFAESSAEYEREVYIREQLDFEAAGAPAVSEDSEVASPKSAYSDAEWTKLAEAIVFAPVNMSLNVGKRSKIKSIREFSALAGGAKKLIKREYKDNALIQALLSGEHLEPDESSMKDFPNYEEALALVKGAGEIVDRATSVEEARDYKQFIVDLTEHVANAAGEGFMGGGEKVSPAELEYLETLRGTLGISLKS
jgi:hypothetical protein